MNGMIHPGIRLTVETLLRLYVGTVFLLRASNRMTWIVFGG
jgi:hypothetical protein